MPLAENSQTQAENSNGAQNDSSTHNSSPKSKNVITKFENRIEKLPEEKIDLSPLLEKRIQLKLHQVSCLKFASALRNLPNFSSLTLKAFKTLLSEICGELPDFDTRV